MHVLLPMSRECFSNLLFGMKDELEEGWAEEGWMGVRMDESHIFGET